MFEGILIIMQKNTLYILRSPSGGGKTTLVESMIRKSKSIYNYHLSADFFMHDGYPEKPIHECPYVFRPELLGPNHKRVFREFIDIIAYTMNDKTKAASIYLDNTNLKWWEFGLYVQVAKKLDYNVVQLIPDGILTGSVTAEDLAIRNKHGVPLEKIREMMKNFESYEDIQRKIDSIK